MAVQGLTFIYSIVWCLFFSQYAIVITFVLICIDYCGNHQILLLQEIYDWCFTYSNGVNSRLCNKTCLTILSDATPNALWWGKLCLIRDGLDASINWCWNCLYDRKYLHWLTCFQLLCTFWLFANIIFHVCICL